MINVSNEFKQAMKTRTDFTQTAKITFADGKVLNLTQSDFTVSNNSVTDGAGSNSFPLGVAIEKTIQIELMNDDDHLSGYDFQGAVIQLFLNFALSQTTETINYGSYTVVTPETYGTTVTIEAVDDMYKADTPYTTSLAFPITLGQAVRDSCSTTGIYLLTTTFKNDDFVIQQPPEDLTHREFLAMAAMLACGYARMDYQGRLCINSYDFSLFEQGGSLDGGSFDASSPYASGDDADGGTFNPWTVGDSVDAGTFAGMEESHVLYNFSSLTVETDDVVITGIQCEDEEGTVHLAGQEGYVLSIENDLITGKEQEAVELIGQSIIGLRFRPFSGEHIAYPLAEFGDLAYIIDRKQNVYQTILTDIDFTFFGLTSLQCAADSPIRNSSKYASELTKAVVTARKNAAAQISEYDKAVQMLTNLMTNSFGVYKTEELQDNGSIIYYIHNKPTVQESETIWKMTADAFAVSTDGGKTWNAGFDSQGNAVLNVLSAIGIKAEWIETDGLVVNHLVSTNGNFNLEAWAASLDIYLQNSPRVRMYCVDPSANPDAPGIAQFFSGNVSESGELLDSDARYAHMTASEVGIGEDSSGAFQGDVRAKRLTSDGNTEINFSRSGAITFWLQGSDGNYYDCDLFREQGAQGRLIFRPNQNLGGYIGSSGYRWDTVFCYDVNESSDRKAKEEISSIDKAKEFVMSLRPVSYKRKGGKRIHMGFIAQEVARAAEENQMGDLSLYQAAVMEEDGSEAYYTPEAPEEQLRWGLTYSELIAPLVSLVQEQEKRISALEEKLKEG